MKSLNVVSGLMLAFCAVVAGSVQADTVKESVACSWTVSQVKETPRGATVWDSCSGNLGTIATRIRGYGDQSGCTLSSNYSYDGTCGAPAFYRMVSTPGGTTPACGVNAGKSYGTVQVGGGASFPRSEVDAFCGSCGFTAVTVAITSRGETLAVTCKP